MFKLIKLAVKGYLYLWIIAGVLIAIVFLLRACDIDESANRNILPVKDSTLVDSRDGQTYLIRRFDKLWWMVENLNYKMEGDLYYKDVYVGLRSYCYDAKNSNCKKYGQLYDLPTAVKACPDGWRLPSYREWERLNDYHANCEWDPASPTGNYRDSLPGYDPVASGMGEVAEYKKNHLDYSGLNKYARYWCAIDGYESMMFKVDIERCKTEVYTVGKTHKALAKQEFYSCRCVKEVE